MRSFSFIFPGLCTLWHTPKQSLYHKKILEFTGVTAIIACMRQGLGLTLTTGVTVGRETKTNK